MIRFDTTLAPLVVVEWEGPIREKDAETYVQAHRGLLDAEIRHVLLADLTEARIVETATPHIAEISQWLEQRRADLADVCVACAFAMGDSYLCRAVDRFCEMRSVDVTTETFEGTAEALEWLQPIIEREPVVDSEPSSLGDPHSSPELVSTDDVSETPDGSDWSPYRRARQSTPATD